MKTLFCVALLLFVSAATIRPTAKQPDAFFRPTPTKESPVDSLMAQQCEIQRLQQVVCEMEKQNCTQ